MPLSHRGEATRPVARCIAPDSVSAAVGGWSRRFQTRADGHELTWLTAHLDLSWALPGDPASAYCGQAERAEGSRPVLLVSHDSVLFVLYVV